MNPTGTSGGSEPGLRSDVLIARSWSRQVALLRKCLRWTRGNIHDAEDLLNDAWLRVVESNCDSDAIRDPISFLSAVIRNLARDRARSARIRGLLHVPDADVANDIAADASLPDELVASRESLTRLGRLLETVPTRQRAALFLRARGEDYANIARELGISQQNARKLVQNARSSAGAARG